MIDRTACLHRGWVCENQREQSLDWFPVPAGLPASANGPWGNVGRHRTSLWAIYHLSSIPDANDAERIEQNPVRELRPRF